MSAFEINAWMHGVPAPQLSRINQLRNMILSLGDDVKEEFKWKRPCYANGKGLFCYLDCHRDYATLGFQKGALLDDPHKLLEGDGQQMRHIKFKDNQILENSAVSALLEQAYRARK